MFRDSERFLVGLPGSPVATRGPALLAFAAGLTVALAPAASANANDRSPESEANAASTSHALEAAEAAFENGRLIVASNLLERSSLQSDEAARLASRIQRALRGLSSQDLAIERTDAALEAGDLRDAERLLQQIDARRDELNAGQARRASLLNDRMTRSIEAESERADDLARAGFAAAREGRFVEAKSLIAEADRLRPALTSAGRSRVEVARAEIFDAEIAAGRVFDRQDVAAALFDGQPENQPETTEAGQPEASPDDIVERSQQAAAQSRFAEAEAQYAEGRRRTAGETYREVLEVYGDYLTDEQRQTARDRVQEVATLLGSSQPDADGGFIEERDAQRQAAERRFGFSINEARRNLETGATDDARTNASQARLVANENRGVLAAERYDEMIDQVNSLLAEINDAEEDLQAAATARRNDEIRQRALAAQTRQENDRERRIVEALKRARVLQAELKYEAAREAVDQALFLDPNNPAALLIGEVLDDIMIYDRFNKATKLKSRKQSLISLENYEATIPPADIIEYPPDWPTISFRRSEIAELALSGEDQRILAKLDRDRISPTFQGDTLEDAIEFVRTVAQVNLDVNWRSLEEVGVTRDTPISLRLDNVQTKVVLDRVLSKVSDPVAPAGWSVKDGVVTIASQSMLDRDVETLVYDVRDLLVEIPDYEELPALDLTDVIRDASREYSDLSVDPLSDEGFSGVAQPTKPDRVAQIMDVIRQNVDFDSWQSNGGSVSRIQDLNGSLVVTTTPKNHRQVSGLLSRLREFRAMQINVEARFLTIDQAFFEQLGFDVDVIFNADNNQVRNAQQLNAAILPSDFLTITNAGGVAASNAGAALPNIVSGPTTPQIVINPATGQPVLDDNFNVVQFTPVGDVTVVPPDGGFSPIGTQSNTLGLTESLLGSLAGEGFAGSVLNAGPALGLAGRFLDDVQVDFLVKATQADQRSSQLTAPRLTFSNGQTANIQVATQQAFVSGLNPIVGTNAVAFNPQIGVLTEGVTLGVEGTVSADRRYVTLSLQTGTNIFNGFSQSAVSAVAGGEAVSSADVASFVQLPTVTVTQVETTVTVPDQGTVLLGGQRIVSEFEVESGVPVLSKIPIINRFFTNRIEAIEEQTLLVLVKPTILIQNEEEEENFPGLIDTLQSEFGG